MLPDWLGSFMLGSAVGGFATLGPTLWHTSKYSIRRVAIVLAIGVVPLGLVSCSAVSVSLPYLFVIGTVAALTAVPIVIAHIVRPNRDVIVAGASGIVLSLVLLAFIQFSIGESFAPSIAPLAALTAAAAGFTAGAIAEYFAGHPLALEL
jgi:hypothetical protein